MPSKEEVRDKGYWDAELESLGINAKRKNALNDEAELEALTENIKQTYYQDYKTAYDREHKIDPSHFGYII